MKSHVELNVQWDVQLNMKWRSEVYKCRCFAAANAFHRPPSFFSFVSSSLRVVLLSFVLHFISLR
eukprot:m.94091 g.94091  ORF g.94091 m.94091 type:complete len:65 (+) comp14714_c0_seq1:262-456(+)